MEITTQIFLMAACAVFIYWTLTGQFALNFEEKILNAINNLNMTFAEFKAAAEAKFQSIEDAIEAEHTQVQQALTELTDTIDELRALVASGGTTEEMEALLADLDGIVAGIQSVYVPPVVEEEEETEEETKEEETTEEEN